MPGVQGLLTKRFQDRVQVEQVAATAVSDVGKLATANPGQNGVVTHSKPFGQVAGIDEDWRHRRFLPAWSVMPGVTIRSAPYGWAVENQATAGKGRPSDFVSPFDSLASETDAATA